MDTTAAQTLSKQFAGNHLLGLLPADELRSLLDYARIETYRARQTIFLKGSEGHTIFAVISGYVKLLTSGPDGRDILLEIAAPGDVFGEVALFFARQRSADAIALNDCKLLAIDDRRFTEVLKRHSDVSLRMMGLLAKRLRRVTEQMEDAIFMDGPARLAKVLVRLVADHGVATPAGFQLDIKLSQRDIGSLIGLSRESINKQLSQWREEGIISLSNQHLTVANLKELKELSSVADF